MLTDPSARTVKILYQNPTRIVQKSSPLRLNPCLMSQTIPFNGHEEINVAIMNLINSNKMEMYSSLFSDDGQRMHFKKFWSSSPNHLTCLVWVQVLHIRSGSIYLDTLSGIRHCTMITDKLCQVFLDFIYFLTFKDLWRKKNISSVDNQGYNISLNSTITTSLGISETSSTSRVFSFLMCKALRNSVTANTFGFWYQNRTNKVNKINGILIGNNYMMDWIWKKIIWLAKGWTETMNRS